jgi:hypothetical protein
MKRLYIDIGSTYYKVFEDNYTIQIKRDPKKGIESDLLNKIKATLLKYKKEDIYITSSANGGLNALIIGVTKSFSMGFAVSESLNSGVNVVDSILLHEELDDRWAEFSFDVVIIVGGINGVSSFVNENIVKAIGKIKSSNIVYAGSDSDISYLNKNIDNMVFLENILDFNLKNNGGELSNYLIKLYSRDIIGKSFINDIKSITSNNILSTPYVVNQALHGEALSCNITSPFLVIDIGGATADIHFSTDLTVGRYSENIFDRLVFKKLGVAKSKKSLLFVSKNNEYMYELLQHLNIAEDIYDINNKAYGKNELMQMSLFLILCKVSKLNDEHPSLQLGKVNELVITGGAAITLGGAEIYRVIEFFNSILMDVEFTPNIVIDNKYVIWTQGIDNLIGMGKYA